MERAPDRTGQVFDLDDGHHVLVVGPPFPTEYGMSHRFLDLYDGSTFEMNEDTVGTWEWGPASARVL